MRKLLLNLRIRLMTMSKQPKPHLNWLKLNMREHLKKQKLLKKRLNATATVSTRRIVKHVKNKNHEVCIVDHDAIFVKYNLLVPNFEMLI